MKLPSISVVIPTYNSAKTLALCLKSIRTQDYPQKLIAIYLADGGSKDATKTIGSTYDTTWIPIDPKKQNVEYNKSTGLARAKGDLVLFVDHDNVLPHPHLLRSMVQPFLDHKDMVGVETLRYHYDPKDTLLDRYFALFGVNDPFAFYMGKADRVSYIYEGVHGYQSEDFGTYFLVHIPPDHIPTVGANGFLVNRSLLLKHADAKPGHYFPIDVNVDMIRKGFTTYAFVKDSITHLSGFGDVWYYLKRRMLFVKQYHLSDTSSSLHTKRRYSLYEKSDTWKLIWFVCISLTFVVPLYDSIRGFRKIHDPAWFINPILCFGLVILYGFVIIEHQVNIIVRKVRQAV